MESTFSFSKTITGKVKNDEIIRSTFLANEPIDKCRYNFRAVWSKAIKRKIVEDNNILFPENISFGEDMVFMLNFYSNMKSTKFISDILYHNFFLHESSATNSYKPKFSDVLYNQSQAILYWIDKYNLDKYLPYHAFLRLDDIILLIKYDFYNKNNNEKMKNKKQRLKKLISEYNYKKYYKLAKDNKLLKKYKLSKRLIIWLTLHNFFFILSLVMHFKYRSRKN